MAAPEDPAQITSLLDAASRGQAGAAEKLLPLVFDELRALARARMAHVPPGNTLQPTALVHEAYLKLVGQLAPAHDGAAGFDNRKHFFGAAARAMRDILVDQARRKGAVKAGGDRRRAGMEAAEQVAAEATPVFSAPEGLEGDLLAMDEALKRLEKDDPRKAEVVMLKYFAGLEHEQIAQALGVSVPTVERDWRFARSWLQKEIGAGRRGSPRSHGEGEEGGG